MLYQSQLCEIVESACPVYVAFQLINHSNTSQVYASYFPSDHAKLPCARVSILNTLWYSRVSCSLMFIMESSSLTIDCCSLNVCLTLPDTRTLVWIKGADLHLWVLSLWDRWQTARLNSQQSRALCKRGHFSFAVCLGSTGQAYLCLFCPSPLPSSSLEALTKLPATR